MCHGDKSDERVLFHRTGSISSDKSRSIGFLIMNTTNVWYSIVLYVSVALVLVDCAPTVCTVCMYGNPVYYCLYVSIAAE